MSSWNLKSMLFSVMIHNSGHMQAFEGISEKNLSSLNQSFGHFFSCFV